MLVLPPCRVGVVTAALLVAVVTAACGSTTAPAPHSPSGPLAGTACMRPASPGARALTITSGGRARTAAVHVPPRLRGGRPAPLLLVIHGAGGTGPSFEGYSKFSTLADRKGFIAVYPTAIDRFWTVNAHSNGPDDVRFVSDLLDRLERDLCVDRDRVFATGLSNGGGMTARLACQLSDRIAAAAPVAGGYGALPTCRPVRPVPVLEMHGDADPVVPYGGSGPGSPESARGYVAGWVARDGCAPRPAARRLARTAVRLEWRGCRAGSAVTHVRIEGGGHDIPGVTPRTSPPGAIFGPGEIWSFLQAHPLRGTR